MDAILDRPALAVWDRWTAESVAELRRMVANDFTDKAIARRLGRTPKAVAAARQRFGLRKHGRVRRRVLRLLDAGYTVAGAAMMVGRTESTVRSIRAAYSRRGK